MAPNPDKGRLYAGQASRRRVRSSGRRARGALFTNTDRGHADCTIAACLRSPAWRTDLTMSTSVRFGCSPRPRLTRRLSPTSCAARASIASTSSQFVLRARHMTTRAGRFSEKTAMANLDAPTAYHQRRMSSGLSGTNWKAECYLVERLRPQPRRIAGEGSRESTPPTPFSPGAIFCISASTSAA